MYSKLQFERNHGCGFQVTEEQFIQIWLKRMEQDSGYAANMRDNVQDHLGIHVTVTGIIESLARMLGITKDPKSLISTFQNQIQEQTEHIQIYINRKKKEAKLVLLDEKTAEIDLVETVIRGIKESEGMKYKLMRKFDKGKIQSLAQRRKRSHSRT